MIVFVILSHQTNIFICSLCLSNTVVVTRNHKEFEEEVDLVEENLRKYIEQEKRA